MAFGCVNATLEIEYACTIIFFEWTGFDEGDEVSGRGWARLDGKSKLVGRLFFHMGDDSEFEATLTKDARPARRRRSFHD